MSTQNAVEQIKDRLSIIDVVASYVKLERAGKTFKAKSPFSNEKTPSFYVSPDRGMYYCFSTNQGGDIFTFVEKMEGVDFKGALKILAERAGIELVPVNKDVEDKRGRLFSVLEAATLFFEKTLAGNAEAKSYLSGRGLEPSTIRTWRIGYALPEWRELYEHLGKQGFTDGEMLGAGLIKPSPKGGGYYDRFRGRIIFPISDTSGRVIAYTGRILPHTSNSEYKEDTAKYLNSPETELFEKSRILYGYHLAKQGIRKFNFSILVEGQIDVIMSHQAGYSNTVAVSGTALTAEQIGLLARLSNNILLSFDADRAGVASSGKGIDLALARGMDVKIAALPRGEDPADVVLRDREEWKRVVGSAKHVIDFYLDYLEAEHVDPRKFKLAVGRQVIPYLAQIKNRIDQAHFVARVSERLSIQEAPVWEEVRRVQKQGDTSAAEINLVSSPPPEAPQNRHDRILERIAGLLLLEKVRTSSKEVIDNFILRIKKILGTEKEKTWELLLEEHENRLLFEAEALHGSDESITLEIEDLMRSLEHEYLKARYQEALDKLKKAESRGDREDVSYLLVECQRLGEALGNYHANSAGKTP